MSTKLLAILVVCLATVVAFAKPCKTYQQYQPVSKQAYYAPQKRADYVLEYRAKDVFIFTGPLPIYNGYPAGVLGDGSEARIVPLVQGETEGLALSLFKSCASCHQEGVKKSGGVTLLDAKGGLSSTVDWSKVLEEVTPNKSDVSRMPPPSSGKPKLAAKDVESIKLLASGKIPGGGAEKLKVPESLSKVIGASCLECHNDNKRKGEVSFSDLSKVTSKQWARSYRSVLRGDMPKDGKPLSDNDAELFFERLDEVKK